MHISSLMRNYGRTRNDTVNAKLVAVAKGTCYYVVIEGSEEHSEVKFVDTGLTLTRYVPHLLATFDVDYMDFDPATADCNESYLMLQQ